MPPRDYLLIAGTASAELGAAVASELGIALAPCRVDRFPDGEVFIEIGESVRRRDVVLLQSTSPPVNDYLMELLLLGDACRRAAAAHITAVVPYFGYARSDRRKGRRSPVSASAVATHVESAGIRHVVTVDVHAAQIEGFFRIPTDDLTAQSVLAGALQPGLKTTAVVVAPDLGAVRRARDVSQRLGCPMALCLKQRHSGTEVEVTGVVGDVADCECLIVDDMISTGATVAEAARALRAAGAREVSAVIATHGVFAPGTAERLREAGVPRVVVTDTVTAPGDAWPSPPDLTVVPIAPLLANAIRRLESGESLRALC